MKKSIILLQLLFILFAKNVQAGARPFGEARFLGNILLGSTNASSQKELRFYEGTNYVGLKAGALINNQIWVLPIADGSSEEALVTDGNGNLSWLALGQSNTVSNVGTTGTGIFKQKTASDLEFYKLNSVNNILTLALNGTDRIDFTINVGNIDHDSTLNYVANEHINHTEVTLTAGTGLSGGGDISANRTFNLTADYSVISANDGATNITGLELEELTDGSTITLHSHAEKVGIDSEATAGYIGASSSDGVLRTDSTIDYIDNGDYVTLGVDESDIDHNSLLNSHNLTTDINHNTLLNYVANEHIDWKSTNESILTTGTISIDSDSARLYLGDLQDSSIYADGTNTWFISPTVGAITLETLNLKEINTASNVGSVGTGIFKQKTGVDLELYKLNSVNNILTLALDGTDKIDFTIIVGNIDHNSLLNSHNLTTDIDHDSTLNYVANEHLDWTQDLGATNINAGNYIDTNTNVRRHIIMEKVDV